MNAYSTSIQFYFCTLTLIQFFYTLLLLWPSLFPFLSFHDSIRYLSYLSTFLELIISLSFLVFRPLKCFSSMAPLSFHFKIIFSVCFSVFLSNVLFLFANHFFRFKNKFTFFLLQRFFLYFLVFSFCPFSPLFFSSHEFLENFCSKSMIPCGQSRLQIAALSQRYACARGKSTSLCF